MLHFRIIPEFTNLEKLKSHNKLIAVCKVSYTFLVNAYFYGDIRKQILYKWEIQKFNTLIKNTPFLRFNWAIAWMLYNTQYHIIPRFHDFLLQERLPFQLCAPLVLEQTDFLRHNPAYSQGRLRWLEFLVVITQCFDVVRFLNAGAFHASQLLKTENIRILILCFSIFAKNQVLSQ